MNPVKILVLFLHEFSPRPRRLFRWRRHAEREVGILIPRAVRVVLFLGLHFIQSSFGHAAESASSGVVIDGEEVSFAEFAVARDLHRFRASALASSGALESGESAGDRRTRYLLEFTLKELVACRALRHLARDLGVADESGAPHATFNFGPRSPSRDIAYRLEQDRLEVACRRALRTRISNAGSPQAHEAAVDAEFRRRLELAKSKISIERRAGLEAALQQPSTS